MYEVIYKYGYFWIANDGELLVELGKFIEPISPEIIIKEIKNEI